MSEPIPFVERRRLIPRPSVVYLFTSDYYVLDVYYDVNIAFAAAHELMKRHPEQWIESRPGRWRGPDGRMIEVKEHTVKTSVVTDGYRLPAYGVNRDTA